MRVKRLKKANRTLTFFRYNYGYIPPYMILLDGTFCQAALQNKINLREQMPKYLADDEVEMTVTNCVLNELEQLGSAVYGSLAICRQFRIAKCPHKPLRTAANCIAHLARRSKTKDHAKYFVATQDDSLLEKLGELGGVPLMSIRRNTILLDKPSEASKLGVENHSTELERIKELKANILGVPEPIVRKRKRPKAPNPLSRKKKKLKVQHSDGGIPGAFGKQVQKETGSMSTKKPRKKHRKRSKAEEGNSNAEFGI